MGISETVNYILFTNPVSAGIGSTAKSLGTKTLGAIMPPQKEFVREIIHDRIPLWKLAQEGGPFVRIAGLMGASAVILGAYGAHRTYPVDKGADLQHIFETGNRYHFLNSLALLGVPLCRYPRVSASLLISGIFLFSGACYYHSFTGKNKFRKVAPIGGTCLILGWLAMVL